MRKTLEISTLLLSFLFICALSSCISLPRGGYTSETLEKHIDYTQMDNWAAHPDKTDPSDLIPKDLQQRQKEEIDVDVFFIHPTSFMGKKGENNWNASLENHKLNKRVDESSIKFQASIFNQAKRIYAPRYRQAHLHAFYSDDKVSSEKALEFAFADVERAFKYYMEHLNEGRPIIIAAHSQGTLHAGGLLLKYFDGKDLQDQLVVAYLVGLPVFHDYFKSLPVCNEADDINCFCSWRTYRKGHLPKKILPIGDDIYVVNPLDWSTKETYVDKSYNKGAILQKFDKLRKNVLGAEIHQGLLWVDKPKFPWSFLLFRKNYHIADLNLFYLDIAENMELRIKTFQNSK